MLSRMAPDTIRLAWRIGFVFLASAAVVLGQGRNYGRSMVITQQGIVATIKSLHRRPARRFWHGADLQWMRPWPSSHNSKTRLNYAASDPRADGSAEPEPLDH
jgi:hypothetical protein